jgi:hypothetical protein
LGHEKLTQARNQLFGEVAKHPDLLVGVRPNGLEDTPQYKIYLLNLFLPGKRVARQGERGSAVRPGQRVFVDLLKIKKRAVADNGPVTYLRASS